MGSYKKKLFIVLLLFLLINFCVCSSVNAAAIVNDYTYNIDLFEIIEKEQLFYAQLFFSRLEVSNITSAQVETLKQKFNNNNYYFTVSTGGNIICNFYSKTTNFYNLSVSSSTTYTHEDVHIYDSNYIYDVSGYIISCYRSYIALGGTSYNSDGPTNVHIPTLAIGYENQFVNNYLNGIPINSSPWAMLQAAIKENTDAVEDTTQAVNNLRNDFNEEESDSDYSYPTDNPTQDVTETSIDTVFNLFYNKINAWSDSQMRIPIPFTGKYFDIPSNLTENLLNSFPAGNVIGRLLGLIWYYLLGVYIIKDVQKYVDGLQTGEILTKSDTNIKTEML